jgi:excisionase family DNA binding protein
VGSVDRRPIRFAPTAEPEAARRAPGRPKKHLLTVADVRAYLNVSRSTLYVLMNEGLPFLRVGHFRRFDLDVVLKWVAEQTAEERHARAG